MESLLKKKLKIKPTEELLQGILLINLGSPDSPTPSSLRKYLKEFLSDPLVIQAPRMIWLPILYGIILPFRSPKSAALYQKIWVQEGSPLIVHSQNLKNKLQKLCESNYQIEIAMRYGSPSIASSLQKLTDMGYSKITAIAMFPQYSHTTAGSIREKIKTCLENYIQKPKINFIADFSTNDFYINCLANSIKAAGGIAKDEVLLLSFHGMPEKYIKKGDPYQKHCENTTKLLAKKLNSSYSQVQLSYQSRFGKEEWLKPYSNEVIANLAITKQKVVVMCPGFTADCLETLEEINIELKKTYYQSGGISFRYISCLNDSNDFAEALLHWVKNRNKKSLQIEQIN